MISLIRQSGAFSTAASTLQSLPKQPSAPKEPVVWDIQRILFFPIPQPVKVQPFFTIIPPPAYQFPLQNTSLEGIQLVDSHYPDEINKKLETQLHTRIQRISRFHDKICAMGRGRGLVIGQRFLDIQGASAYAYGPDYLVIAFENCNLTVYSMDLKPIKQFKKFSKKKITMIRMLRTSKSFLGLILLTSTGRDMIVYRLQKSFFSTLSVSLNVEIMSGLSHPITHLTQIPMALQLLLYQDVSYQDTTLMAVMCLDRIWVIRFANYRLTFDKFWDVVYEKRWKQQISVTSCSWGEAKITSTQKQIFGERVVLTYGFGKNLFLATLNSNNQYLDGQTKVKYQWLESHPFSIQGNENFVFCQFMKRNELMLVTDENKIIIFHTENAQLFDRPRSVANTPCLIYKFDERLKGQKLQNVKQNKIQPSNISQEDMEDIPAQLLELLGEVPIVTYSESFSHYYQSPQVYFLTERQFGIYQYKNWKQICESLKTQQKYQAAMRFLIALYLKVNRFDLGIQHTQNSYNYDLSEYSKILAIQFLQKKLSNLIQMPQLLEKFNVNPLISIPVQFLVRMNQFGFLFEVLRGKIISYTSQDAFYRVLEPFAEHGRIKFIPQGQLREVLRYYINKGDTDIVERMAIHFDVDIIDRGIVIQQLIENHLVVSLAYVCTQGNEIQFLTPFAKYWSMSDNQKRRKNIQKAQFYASRALYYVKICLQRNMALKSYSYQKYASMIELLTSNFFTKKMLMGLMRIDMESTIDALSYYFSIQISGIINESAKFKLQDVGVQSWINQKQGNHNIQLLLSGIYYYCSQQGMDLQQKKLFYVLLSRIIIYKTIKFTNEKYIDILSFLINNYTVIQKIKYGLDADQLQNYEELCSREEAMEILASGYISKLLQLVNQEFPLKKSLTELFEVSRRVPLTQLQAHICLLQGNYKASIEIYLRGRESSKMRVFEFLTDTFHNFSICKNKKQSAKLMDVLRQYVPNLISLSPIKSRDLIQQYMPSYQEQLILGLQNQPLVQLQYLEHIIPNQNTSQKSTIRYIELMCKYKPNELINSFKKYPHLPIEESLQICKKNDVFQCMQFLYERMGNIQQSVKIAALRIDKLFLLRFNSVDIDEYEYYSQVAQILNNAIETCVNNKSEEIWSILLDSMINIFNNYKERIEFNQEIIVFYQINAKILNFMARYCSIDYLVELLDARYTGLDMGGSMKKSFIDMLNNFSYSENILFSARSLNRDSYWQSLHDRWQTSLKAYLPSNWCENCQERIQRQNEAVCYPCRHTYHKECVLKDNPYCLSCLSKLQYQLQFYLSIPNPQKPPIKIEKLFAEAQKIELLMKQKFKIHDYEQRERNRQDQIAEIQLTNKLERFKRFDAQVDLAQFTNQQVQQQLEIQFKKLVR